MSTDEPLPTPDAGVSAKKRLILSALGWVMAIGLLVALVGPFTFFDRFARTFSPILPRPDGVPRGATASYSVKDGAVWSWGRSTPSGCVKWFATEDFASLRLALHASNCDRNGDTLDYQSFDDFIVFYAGGENGPGRDWVGGKPCPYSIKPPKIGAFQNLSREASSESITAREKAILNYVGERLAKVNADALTTDHTGGCNDLKPEDYESAPKPTRNLWTIEL